MRILYVGNGNLKHRGACYYDVGRKLMNGLIRAGHNVYFLSDRDTARAANLFGTRKLGVGHANRVFLDTCRNFRPEMILLGHADIITPESLERVRAMLPGARVAQFNVDPVFRPHNDAMIRSKLPFVDATFITTAGPVLARYHRDGAAVAFMPNPVDASMEWPRCFASSDQPHDVFWALRALKGSYPGDPRLELPLYLERSGQVTVDYHGMNGKAELFNARYYEEIANARMGLNISVTRDRGDGPDATAEERYLYASDRIAHYMGSGLLTFTPRGNRLEELFEEDREMVFFASPEELLEKAVQYKHNAAARRAVAEAGWKKYHACFDATLVARFIVDVTFSQTLSHDYAWPVERY